MNIETAPREALVAALRGVLAEHVRAQFGIKWCDGCDAAYPCPTVRAIEAALGGDPR